MARIRDLEEGVRAVSYVGIGLRLVATIIDTVVMFIVMYVVALATGNTTSDGFSMSGAPAFLGFIVWALYYVGMEATSGATIGKMAVGIKVVRADGSSPIGWGPALIRNVLRIVDGLFVYVVGAIFVMTSPTKQRLGDRVANTVVVRRSSVGQPAAS
jgi:uncharacterized RDD family membrane protein YckC